MNEISNALRVYRETWPRCATCKHFWLDIDSEEGYSDRVGECHLNPPLTGPGPLTFKESKGVDEGYWPKIYAGEFCGRHEQGIVDWSQEAESAWHIEQKYKREHPEESQ